MADPLVGALGKALDASCPPRAALCDPSDHFPDPDPDRLAPMVRTALRAGTEAAHQFDVEPRSACACAGCPHKANCFCLCAICQAEARAAYAEAAFIQSLEEQSR